MHITSGSGCLQTLGTDFHKHPWNGSESGENHRKGVPAEMTSQRTQTAQVRGQAIAMSEKSSTFALAFGT